MPREKLPAGESCVPIRRDIARRIVKPSVKILLFAAISSGVASAPDIAHATFFIFGISTEIAVVAIDSRETIKGLAKSRFNDRFCKIKPLSPTAFFFSAGLAAALRPATGKVTFDTRDIAKDVYAGSGNSQNFDELAEKWALRTEAAVRKSSLAPSMLKDTTTRGYFLGTKDNGEIGVGAETIVYSSDSPSHLAHTPVSFTLTASPQSQQPLDKPAIAVEQEFFHGGQTERAKKIIEDNAWAKIGAGADAQAVRYSNLVAAVRDWGGNDKVGGDIATIVLERGKNWRWFHRPDFCPEK